MSIKQAKWSNGKTTITGTWQYVWSRDVFVIRLDGRDPVTNIRRAPFETHNDSPEWGKWKLVGEAATATGWE